MILTRVKEATSQFIKVLRYGKSDIQTASLYSPAGIDSKPIKEQVALYAKTGEKGKSVVVGYLLNSTLTSEGETRIFSINSSGVEQFYIMLNADGICNMNGTGDFLAKFNELKTGFDQLKSDFNTFLIHVHGSSGTPPVPPQTPSTASIDNAKIEDITVSG